jgi:anti-sigma regulatory factor (Ser/Thr protein kinase)
VQDSRIARRALRRRVRESPPTLRRLQESARDRLEVVLALIVRDLTRVWTTQEGKRALTPRVVLARQPPPEPVLATYRFSRIDRQPSLKGQPAHGSPELQYAERVELELDVADSAPRRARLEVREAVAGKLSPSDSEIAVLLTSELVTNAVVHPAHRENDSIRLQISTDIGRTRVEVADSGGGFEPTALKPGEKARGGRGLLVVDRGAVRWGTSRDDRFRIWFELS